MNFCEAEFAPTQLLAMDCASYTRYKMSGPESRLKRTFSGVRGCWIGFALLILSFGGCSEWMDASRREWASDAEYILSLEKEGKLEQAVKDGRVSEHAARVIEEYRAESGPIRFFKITRSFGYPKGLGHGGAEAVILRGEQVFVLSTMSEKGTVFSWYEQPQEGR